MARIWGGIGAAASTGITMIITSGFILNFYYWKEIGLDIRLFWKNITVIFLKIIPVVVISYFCNILFQNRESIIILLVKILIYCGVYMVVMYFGIMDKREKSMVNTILHRLPGVRKFN